MKHKKLLYFLLMSILFMVVVIYLLNRYVISEVTIAEKIGNYMPMSISIEESIHVRAYSVSVYFSLLDEGEYEKAYGMLTDEYKRFMPFDEYVSYLKGYDYSNYQVKSIKQLGQLSFVVTLFNSETDEEQYYFVYANRYNNKKFTISPDKFLYFDRLDKSVFSNGVEATMESYTVYQDSIIFNFKFKNKSSKTIYIEDVIVDLVGYGRIENKFETMTLDDGEEQSCVVTFEDIMYYIPKKVTVETDKTTLMFEL